MIRRATLTTVVIAALAASLLILVALPGAASASVSCDLVAGPEAGVEDFANSLTPGQTGCLRGGDYSFEELKVTAPGITLASYPGETATLHGRVWVAKGADGVTFSGLAFDGRNSRELPSPSVNAADTTFDEVDVTSHHASICFKLGDSEYGRAVDTVIEDSKIHDCGRFPNTNMQHGIYIGQSDGAVIRDNYIYDNADRGVQVYPDAQGTQIVGNVIDGNGEGVVISGDGQTASSGTVVRHNVISNSRVRWNVESSWPDGVVGSNNVVRENCIYATNGTSYYNMGGGILPQSQGAAGFSAGSNVTADPEFVDEADGDFNLRSGSPCEFTQSGGQPPAEEGTIVISPAPNAVKPQAETPSHTVAQVNLVGKSVQLRKRLQIKIVRWDRGRWRKVTHTRVPQNGHFHIHARVRLRGNPHRLRLRALIPGLSRSRSIVLSIH